MPNYVMSNYMANNPSPNVEIVTKGEELGVVSAVAKKAMPSVVGITTITIEKDFFFGVRKGQGVGTGVIIDSRGYILTNSHVVNDGKTEEVNVLFYDGSTKNAEVLWNDLVLDLAVVKVNKTNLPVADLGNSDKIEVGEVAIAIGNPLGLAFERTVTAGIISGLNRSIPIDELNSIEGLIQTDASINPGNSGGPLLNSKGEVIGINTAKIQSGEGLGFAVPINIAKPIVDEFIEKGEFKNVYLGLRGIDVAKFTSLYAEKLPVDKGVVVYQIFPNSPVAIAGLEEGDIITKINDTDIESMRQLVRVLYKYRPNDKINLRILRNNKQITLDVVLKATPNK
ncbi:2-alkenal reductase [Anaeromicrobium sediminis]|uniref:2-alkenal reductase n=2 Tax=Anaeromicrobium sediminis TaxID=1478221 RepID=A0A267MKY8_9FIRM|nr:2-alkenal reductase [Anaeromicrobium sediminis]